MPRLKKKVPKSSSRRSSEASAQAPPQAPQAPPQQETEHQAQARRRRYEAHRTVLTELRRIERHMQPAIARLPFQRVVRNIASNNQIRLRWTPSALLCLQEAAEDWMIEFFEDAYFLAAHAHRVTIMPKDFCTLRCIRYRHDRLLEPVLSGDRRMEDILTIPPLHPRRREREHQPVMHDRNTRSQMPSAQEGSAPVVEEIPADDSEWPAQQTSMDEEESQRRFMEAQAQAQAQEEIERIRQSGIRQAAQERATARLQARQREIIDQEAVNRVALSDYAVFNVIRIAFTIGEHREVEALRREDLQIFGDGTLQMSDLCVKVIMW